MAKKKAPKKAVKAKPKAEPKVDLEKKIAKLEEYIKAQVDIKQLGGDAFASYPEL